MEVRKSSVVLLTLLILVSINAGVRAQSSSSSTEVLTLVECIDIALRNNLELRNAALEISKAEERLAARRTRRLPSVHLDIFGAQQLKPIDFTFHQGAFGSFPLIGPVPGKETVISTPLKATAIFVGRVAQPLSDLYRIGLDITRLSLTRDLAQERSRQQQHEIIQSIKQVYFAILQAQGALESARANIKLYRELDRTTEQYVLQQVALKADSLDMKVRLAKTEYEALVLGNQITEQKQKLNRLLGRDVLKDFSVQPISSLDSEPEVEVAAARSRALEHRPELAQAHLKVKLAQWDRRLKKSEFIPDASINFQYFSPRNYNDIVPKNIAQIGISLRWEVFDWGRKKHELNEKDLIIEQLENEVRQAETSVLLEVEQKFRNVQQTRQLLHIAELSQQAAREHVRVLKDRYEVQVALMNQVLQAQTAVEQANSDYQRALSSFWTAKAEFEKATGEDQ
ncbi:MAG: TolC family protein [Acidobacteria bacterium]|nr:TolC family protein [Acidobacteriota bacterium]